MNRHLWQIQPVRDLLMLGAVWLVIYLGYLTSVVTVPVLLAMALAYMFEPLVRVLTRSGRFTRQGVAGILILLAIVLGVIPALCGLVFGTIQAAQGVQTLAVNVEWLVKSVERPEDKSLSAAPPGEAWGSIREWIVEQQNRAREAEKAREEYRRKQAEAAERAHAGDAKPAAQPGDPSSPTPTTPTANTSTPEAAPQPTPAAPAHEHPPETAPHAADLSHELGEPPPPGPLYQATAWSVNWLKDNREQIGKRAIQAGAQWANWAINALSSIGYLGFTAFLTAFFFYFFCSGYGRVLAFWEGLIPERRKGKVVDLLRQMDAVIAAFIRGRLTICAALIGFYTFSYGLIGVPGWLILGPLVGALSLLPYVAGLGAPVAMLLMWLDPSGGWQNAWWWILGAPVAVSMLSQVLDDYILTPMIQGKSTGMDTPTILFASLAGGVLAGVYGLLLAIPAAACLKILLREVFWPRFRDWASGDASDFIPLEKE